MNLYELPGSAVPVPQKEVCRYLGYRGISPDEAIADRIQSCIVQLQEKSHPRSVWLPCSFFIEEASDNPANTGLSDRTAGTGTPGTGAYGADAPVLHIGDMIFPSRQLAGNLRGCQSVVLMAATIGPGADFLIRRAEATDMLDAAILQAAGAAMAESWCDLVNRKINDIMKEKGLWPRPRFSPGYGDVPLALQKDFSSRLSLPASCGISLTETLLMVPSKSVTAFIGFSEKKEPCVLEGCEVCSHAQNCAFRRTSAS